MQEEVNWSLLAVYLAGEATPQQERQLRQWANEQPAHATLLAEMQAVYQARVAHSPRFDAASAFERLTARLSADEAPAPDHRRVSKRPGDEETTAPRPPG